MNCSAMSMSCNTNPSCHCYDDTRNTCKATQMFTNDIGMMFCICPTLGHKRDCKSTPSHHHRDLLRKLRDGTAASLPSRLGPRFGYAPDMRRAHKRRGTMQNKLLADSHHDARSTDLWYNCYIAVNNIDPPNEETRTEYQFVILYAKGKSDAGQRNA